MKTRKQHKNAPQGASDTVTSGAAVADGRDTNALTIPPLKNRLRMLNRIWKRLDQAVGTGLFFEILADAVHRMLNDLERANNGVVSLTESDLFASDGSLNDKGYNYVADAFEKIGDLVDESETLNGLTKVLDKECFTYFMIERTAAKQAEGKHTPKRTGSVG